MSKVAPYVWRHPDGRRIEVYPKKKVWGGHYLHPQMGTQARHPVFAEYRPQSWTDEQWYASPGPEWTGCSYNDLPPNENIPIQR